MSAIYLDASAFVKLVVGEPESRALHDYLAREPGRHLSSAVLRTEAMRAAARYGPEALGVAREALGRVDLVSVDDRILERAGLLHPDTPRSIDAIHLATAAALGDDLRVIVTYDERMIEAASLLGLPTATPV